MFKIIFNYISGFLRPTIIWIALVFEQQYFISTVFVVAPYLINNYTICVMRMNQDIVNSYRAGCIPHL